jgi:hypothetical protein
MRSSDVAPKHALITRGADGVMLRPLDSEHPIYVNGTAAGEQPLDHGDTIRLGPFELKVSIQGSLPKANPTTHSPAPSSAPLGSSASAAPSTGWQSLARITKKPTDPEPPAFVPERLAEIQRSQADADKELERRRRQLQEELAKIESERAQFKQEKTRFETHRQDVDRQLRDAAAREADLARLARDLEDRQRQVIEGEQQLEVKRNSLADQSIQFDHRLEVYEARRLRLLRIRRKLIDQYRQRFERTSGIETDVARREEKLRLDRAEHEAEVTHWKRVADELGRKQAELKRMEAEIARRHEVVERRETELRDRQSRFESDLAQTHSKDRSLDALRADLERRRTLLTEEEASLREARRAVEDQFERAKVRSNEIQRRHDEVESRRLTLEKQEQYLRDQAAALEKHRVMMVELDRDLAARQANIDQAESAVAATRQHLETKDADLRIRELSLSQTQELLASKEATLREWESQKELDQRAIDKRLIDLQVESSQIAEQIKAEQKRIEDRRHESEQLYQASQKAKDEVEDERDRWLAKMSQAREMSAEVAHRESIVEARQRQIDSASQRHQVVSHEIAHREQKLENDRRLLDLDRSKVETQSQESKDRSRLLQAEVARLRELSLELERRQQSLIERETRWSKDVTQRKLAWQQAAQDLTHRQEALERQAETQKQRVAKLRDLTAKLFGRSARVDQKAEAIKDHHQHQVEQIQSAQSSQQSVLERLLREVQQFEEQSAQSNQSIEHLRAEQDRLARVREDASQSIDPHSGNYVEETQFLDRWSEELARALSEIEARSRAIDAGQEKLAEIQSLLPTESTNDAPSTRPASNVPVTAAPTATPLLAEPPRWKRVLATPDDELIRLIVPTNLIDANKLNWLKQSAASRGSRLAEEIVRSRHASGYQLEAVLDGKTGDLVLGPATISDLIHEGGVATTYLVKLKNSDRPMAARMLKPIWSRDPARRRQYEIVLNSLKSFVHPNVVAVHGSLMVGERFGSLADYVPSVSLEHLMGVPLPASSLVTITHQALSAIAFAERAGIAHLAIRPSRILLSSGGQVQLLGFSEPDWLRRVHWCERGKMIQRFASPEVAAAAGSADSRADVYSIGAIAGAMILQSTGASSLTDRSLAEEYPAAVLDLIRSMQDPSATSRPRAHEAVEVLSEMASPQSLVDWPDLAARLEEFDRVYPGRAAA